MQKLTEASIKPIENLWDVLKLFQTCKNDSHFVHFTIHTSFLGTFGCLLNDWIICLGLQKTLLQRKTQMFAKQYSWRKACCDLALSCISRIATIVVICLSHRKIKTELHYQGNIWCNIWGSSSTFEIHAAR